MNLTGIAQKVLGSSEIYLRKNAPAILTGVGIAGFAATTVLVGRAVLKSQDDLDSVMVKSNHAKKKEITEEYPQEAKVKEVGEIWVRGSMQLAKHYWLPATVGLFSVGCILTSHGMMKKRNASIAAAYVALDAGFKAYRKRVSEELGAEKELDFYRGVKSRKEITDLSEVDGEGTEKCIINEYGEQVPSPYARFFDESSVMWSKDPEYNLLTLRAQEQWANDRLTAKGIVFLNEVYENLGLERSQAGQSVGWKKKNPGGDGFISFGLYDIFDESSRAFINGLEHTVLLDFNVDGVVTL
jgi:hypothetical protein